MPLTNNISSNKIAASVAFLAALCFATNDAAIKALSGSFALPQLMFVRSLLAIPFIIFVVSRLEGADLRLRGLRHDHLLLRGLLMVLANLLFFLGLALLPLAETVGVFFVAPLLTTVFSVFLLGETVGPRRWLAIFVGLIGVLVMIRPGGAGFQVAMLLPLAAAMAYSLMNIVTRRIGSSTNGTVLALYIQIVFFLCMGALGLAFGDGALGGTGGELFAFLLRPWGVIGWGDLSFFVLIAVASTGAFYFIGQAYRIGEASFVAPFEYIALPTSVAYGVVLFGDWPDLTSWIGILLIVLAGIFVLRRENDPRSV